MNLIRKPYDSSVPTAASRHGPTRLTRRWVTAVGVVLALIPGCLLALVLLAPSAGLDGVRGLVARRFPDVHRIDAAALAAAMSADGAQTPLLLDTRTEAEFAISHLRGAVRFDPQRPLLAQVGGPGAHRIVVYCSVGYRSAIVARSLAVVGVRDVQNLDGGIFTWANADRAVYRGGERVREVHPYDAVWGLFLRTELRVSPRAHAMRYAADVVVSRLTERAAAARFRLGKRSQWPPPRGFVGRAGAQESVEPDNAA